jgi:hypothetical protein
LTFDVCFYSVTIVSSKDCFEGTKHLNSVIKKLVRFLKKIK